MGGFLEYIVEREMCECMMFYMSVIVLHKNILLVLPFFSLKCELQMNGKYNTCNCPHYVSVILCVSAPLAFFRVAALSGLLSRHPHGGNYHLDL